MSRCTTLAMALFDGKYPTSYLMAIVMFALCLSIGEIKNGGQDQGLKERYLRHSIGNGRFHVGDFFRILATRQHRFTQI